jgi:CheY-like chemotaxis protein
VRAYDTSFMARRLRVTGIECQNCPLDDKTFIRMARILIVGDDATLREPVFRSLGTHGHEVEAISDATQAIIALHQAPFDLVISDIQMPFMDGLELAVAIRGDGAFDGLPVLFLTAPDDDGTWKQAKFLGGAHLVKPVACEALLRAVDRALQYRLGSEPLDESSHPLPGRAAGTFGHRYIDRV